MRTNTLRRICFTVAMIGGLAATQPCAAQISANWLPAGGGDYGDPLNWDAGVVPLNTGPVEFVVGVAAGAFSNSSRYSSTLTLGTMGSWGINSLDLGAHRRLFVLSGVELTTPDLTLAGTIECEGGSFTATQAVTMTGTRTSLAASLGGQVELAVLDYNATGLTANNGSSTAGTFSWPIITATDAGSSIDLSTVTTFDDSFGQNSNETNRHEVSASGGASIDFSGLTTVTGPSGVSDWLRFTVSGLDSELRFDSLAQVLGTSGRGRVIFEVDDAALTLPALETLESAQINLANGGSLTIGDPLESIGGLSTATNVRVFAAGGATLEDDGTPASFAATGLTANNASSTSTTFTWPILTASDPDTRIDLSSLTSFDDSFPQNSNEVNRHEVSATTGATIDLSGLVTMIGPSGVSDWVRFTLSGQDSELRLDALEEVFGTSSRGRVVFEVDDSTLALPSLQSVESTQINLASGATVTIGDTLQSAGGFSSATNFRVFASGGSTLTDDGTPASFSGVGLTANNGSSTATTFTWPIITATDPGTVIDLSSFTEFDESFVMNSNEVNRHEVSSTGGATIDLSGLTTITGPSGASDWVRFTLAGADSELRLDSLAEVLGTSGRGRVVFEVDDAALTLPALESLESTQFDVSNGATVTVGDPLQTAGGLSSALNTRVFASGGASFADDGTPANFSTVGLNANNGSSTATTFTWPILTATDPATMVDLGSCVGFDAGFIPNSNDVNRHEVTAENGGLIDLSGVVQITKPSGGSDWVRFSVLGGTDGSGVIDLSSLTNIVGAGSGRAIFDVTDGTMILGSYAPSALSELDVDLLGTVDVLGDIAPTFQTTIVTSGAMRVGGSVVGSGDLLRIQATEGTLELAGDLHFENTVEDDLTLENLELHCDGGGSQTIEAGGLDVGTATQILTNGNFGIGRLVVGSPGNPTTVNLIDLFDNGNTGGGNPEALYLWGLNGQPGLEIAPGSTLCLGTLPAYFFDGTVWQDLTALISPNPQPALGGGILCGTPPVIEFSRGESNGDGTLNIADALYTLDYLFLSGPLLCADAADADDDGQLTISDPINIVFYLFSGGPPPLAPFQVCGVDPSLDGLGCDSYPPCP